MSTKREFYAAQIKKHEAARSLSLARARIAKGAQLSKTNPEGASEQFAKAVALLLPSSIGALAASHTAEARRHNRERLALARVLNSLPAE